MKYKTITKDNPQNFKVRPNLYNYEAMRKDFKWEDIHKELDFLPGGGLNLAYEAIDRHTKNDKKNKIALIWDGKNNKEEKYTFQDMSRLSNQFANILDSLGVKKGDRVFTYLDRVPELYISIIGIAKTGAIIGPLFSAFGTEAIKDRLSDSGAKVLITSPQLLANVDAVKKDLPELKHIIIVNKHNVPYSPKENEIVYEKAMAGAKTEYNICSTDKEDFSIMHYTSGTTGKPKGAAHVHEAIVGHYATAKYVLDLHSEDIYWCTADPGWVTGTSYGIFGPWANGVTQLVSEIGFQVHHWYDLISKYKVTVWYTAPTAIRMLMKYGEKEVKKHNLSSLRYINSVGEPLNPEAVIWSREVFGMAFHDNWWQTETGCIQIANYAVQDIKPGSMGRPFPGVKAAIINDNFTQELPAGEEGHLCLKYPWPSMFRTYWNKKDLYNSRFKNGWYITGDKARMDNEGYFHFVGRADDVMNVAGHLVGPFEVESALVEHPAVAEAGVIGIPDPIRMEVVKAFVSLREGFEPSEKLKLDIKKFVAEKLDANAAPKEIEILKTLPKTRSGKIMRRLLKARELGLPEGDTSTLEE
ncbi:acetate--CoA ligase [Candidatus Desantisbacteria bacterium]|nr:acetate--CoA ligase [Candidatus Desantisbacteria bacterium]